MQLSLGETDFPLWDHPNMMSALEWETGGGYGKAGVKNHAQCIRLVRFIGKP